MHNFTNANKTLEVVERKETRKAPLQVDPDEEIMHIQADGFWGFEKGFHDVEEHRR